MTEPPIAPFVPCQSEMFGWIEAIVAAGIRRPGSAADRWCEEWIAERLVAMGVEDVRHEPVELAVWEERSASLTAWLDDDPGAAVTVPAFALPHSAPAPCVEAPLRRLADDPVGAIAVSDHSLLRVPQAFMKALATSVHDPDGELDGIDHVLPFTAAMQLVLEPTIEAGAVGFVGVLSGFPWNTCDYYVPYDGVQRPIPAVWVSAADGGRLSELFDSGHAHARLEVDASRARGTSYNITGTLPGRSDEWIVIGTHHDAPWASAVEDASGVAMVLAQAQYWSQVPASERPHNLLFLFNAGHMVDGAGCQAFVDTHADLLSRTVLAVHLEHAAEACETVDGRLVPTGQPEARWWFTSTDPALETDVASALAAEKLGRSLVYPPTALGPRPPTDGGFMHDAGVPLVNFLSAPMYLFDSCDTLDKVHRESLVPITRATIRVILASADRTAEEARERIRS